jgi:hypothetical protein
MQSDYSVLEGFGYSRKLPVNSVMSVRVRLSASLRATAWLPLDRFP